MFLLRKIRRRSVVYLIITVAGLVAGLALLSTDENHEQKLEQKNQLETSTKTTITATPAAADYTEAGNSTVLQNQIKRQRHLAEACKRLGLGSEVPNFKIKDMYINDTLRYLYCVVNKVACTTWKRVLLMAGGARPDVKKPEQLSQTYVHNWHVTDEYIMRIRKYSQEEVLARLKTHFKFVFVRHPLERLVSTYRDKFTKRAYYYPRRFGTKIVRAQRGSNASADSLRRGHDVNFPEMVRYLLDPPPGAKHNDRLLSDNHWRAEADQCHPCFIKFDFIGHYETLYDDAQYVLRRLGVADRVSFPNVDPDNRWKKKTKEVVDGILSQITPEELRRVRQLYAHDFELFGYE